jgi:CheY-like chemotaxis protein
MDSVDAAERTTNEDTEQDPWVILVADDDEMVHLVTELVLKDLTFEGKPVRLIRAKSAEETREFLENHCGVAVLLLDVVMETLSAGLDLVPVIRGDLRNHELRIIVRTGQAGHEEQSSIIRRFDINGFTRKEELRHQDLRDTVILGLRAYRDIQNAKQASA